MLTMSTEELAYQSNRIEASEANVIEAHRTIYLAFFHTLEKNFIEALVQHRG